MTNQEFTAEKLQLSSTAQEGNFPVPITIDEFRHHVLNLYFLKMRTIAFMTDEETAWRITGKQALEEEHSLADTEIRPEDLGLSYDDIREKDFAKCLESMYQFAYFGAVDDVVNGLNCMEYGSHFTLYSTIVNDMTRSLETRYWDENSGATDYESALKCYHFVEVANARSILENNRNFLYYDDSKEEDSPSYDERFALSIPQMALLSGMGEMSIRAAANPKRSNALKTYSDNGRTRIANKDAKEWLQIKGRYVPIIHQSAESIILTKRKFNSFDDLKTFIRNRCSSVTKRSEMKVDSTYQDFDRAQLLSENFVHDLAKTLDLPVKLFALRIRELLARDELNVIARELRNIVSLPN